MSSTIFLKVVGESFGDFTHDFVDLYKVGRANYLKELTRTTDWRGYTEQMIERLSRLGKQHYIKQDLQPYLPPGYVNPLRVPQHHGSNSHDEWRLANAHGKKGS